MNWFAKLLAHGLVRWIVGTTVQTGIIVTFVYSFMSITFMSMDSRMSDIQITNNRIETKFDNRLDTLIDAQVANAALLGKFEERFNSIDNEFTSIRRELAISLDALATSIERIDKAAAVPLREWGQTYLASIGGSDLLVQQNQRFAPGQTNPSENYSGYSINPEQNGACRAIVSEGGVTMLCLGDIDSGNTLASQNGNGALHVGSGSSAVEHNIVTNDDGSIPIERNSVQGLVPDRGSSPQTSSGGSLSSGSTIKW